MKRPLAIFAVLALLALPVMAGAQENWIPPETRWTPTPPAQETVDATRLMELLKQKGVLTQKEQSELTQQGSEMRTGQSQEQPSTPNVRR